MQGLRPWPWTSLPPQPHLHLRQEIPLDFGLFHLPVVTNKCVDSPHRRAEGGSGVKGVKAQREGHDRASHGHRDPGLFLIFWLHASVCWLHPRTPRRGKMATSSPKSSRQHGLFQKSLQWPLLNRIGSDWAYSLSPYKHSSLLLVWPLPSIQNSMKLSLSD